MGSVLVRAVALATVAALTLSCSSGGGGSSSSGTSPGSTVPTGSAPGHSATTVLANPRTAPELREALTLALNERVLLTAALIDATFHGRQDESAALEAALLRDGGALAELSTDVLLATTNGTQPPPHTDCLYGCSQGTIDFSVDSRLATLDEAVADYAAFARALATDDADALQRAKTSTAFRSIGQAPAQALADLGHHLDDGDLAGAAEDLGRALHAVPDQVADALGNIGEASDEYPGDAFSKAADLQVGLSSLLQQHVAIASFATGAALGGRDDQFVAYKELLDQNTQSLSDAVGAAFGEQAGEGFHESWNKHIGFFVDYTQGVAGDPAKKQKAADDLTAYADELSRFFNAALPELPRATLRELILGHLVGLEQVIDAQGEKDWSVAATRLTYAMDHMRGLAEPLAGATVRAFPDKFPTS